ncbi:MAG: ABC transporter ATP-binding protein, partial [Bacteroidales bacterium]|nr:ABC transporter ATP-binding protein [Bacteroidales bacterium]
MLTIEHLTKRYGEKTAVDDLSLHIGAGEIYGFIGPNGAGKTTTIKACCGLLQFDSGEIRIGGDSVQEKPLACKAQTAYLPDNPDLYDFMTGAQYLRFIADIFRIPADIRKDRIGRLAGLFEITDDLTQP